MLKSILCFCISHTVCAVDVVLSHPEAEDCVMTLKYLNKLYDHKFVQVHHHNLVFTISLCCTYSENICVFGRICLYVFFIKILVLFYNTKKFVCLL